MPFPCKAFRVPSRRTFLTKAGLTATGAALLVATARCSGDDEQEVGAVEDLMREHGVLRRALLVYGESAARLRAGDTSVDLSALNAAAKLFRAFGEDYHERQLEEAYIFPAIRNAGGDAAALADVLTAQHARGREITDYIDRITAKGNLAGTDAAALADVFDNFAVMYENHAAREDTIVFPAWKATLSKKQLDELGDTFEDIEKKTFGTDGFEDAVKKIDDIEGALGFADLESFTAPPPPKG